MADVEDAGAENETDSNANNRLPIARIRTIMRSSPGVQNISHDCLYTIRKATELFVQDLARITYEQGDKHKMEYKHLSDIVHTDETLEFLQDIIPKKILAKDYFKMLQNERRQVGGSAESS